MLKTAKNNWRCITRTAHIAEPAPLREREKKAIRNFKTADLDDRYRTSSLCIKSKDGVWRQL